VATIAGQNKGALIYSDRSFLLVGKNDLNQG
jgi:hypothetical protein